MTRMKKRIVVAVVLVLSVVIMLTTWFGMIKEVVAATTSMPGIEQIIANQTQSKEPCSILEIENKKGEEELGYYISGEELYLNDPTTNQHYESLEDGLKTIEEEEGRRAFAQAESYQDVLQHIVGEGQSEYPITIKPYEEVYMLNSEQEKDWKEIQLDEKRNVMIRGSYEPNKNQTGDYTKEKQTYYPIREDVTADQEKEGYQENISSFAYSEGAGQVNPYEVTFEPIKNEEIQHSLESDKEMIIKEYQNGYGYYINDYRTLTNKVDRSEFPGEDGEEDVVVYRATKLQEYPNYRYDVFEQAKTLEEVKRQANQEGTNIIEKKGVYYYRTRDENGSWKEEKLYYIQGKKAISYQEVKFLSDELGNRNYYYKVSHVQFCCRLLQGESDTKPENYEYYGWYYANIKEGQETYVPVKGGEQATYYISDARYQLTKGTGNYDFVPDDKKEQVEVEIDHFYYKGGFQNHDWFKRYVFHLERNQEEEDTFDKFQITVTEQTTEELEKEIEMQKESYFESYDLIYVHGDISNQMLQWLKTGSSQKDYALILRLDCMTENTKQQVKDIFSEGWNQNDQDGCYVSNNIYFFTANETCESLLTSTFHDALFDFQKEQEVKQSGFEEIVSYIQEENKYRELEDDPPIEESVSIACVMEYLFNYPYKRLNTKKDTIRVLEIQPLKSNGQLKKSDIYEWIGETKDSQVEVIIDCMTSSEFVGHTEDLNTKYDLIYIGDDNSYWNTDSNQEVGLAGSIVDICNDDKQDAYYNQWSVYRMFDDNKQTSWATRHELSLHPNNKYNGKHYMTMEFEDPIEVFGFTYLPYHGGTYGRVTKYQIQLTLADGTTAMEEGTMQNNTSLKTIRFKNIYHDVKQVTFIPIEMDDPNVKNMYATCAEFRVLTWANKEIGRFATPSSDILYAHIGGKILDIRKRLKGILDTEYVDNRTKLAPNIQLRGSGNDITEQQVKALQEFVKAGYPVVLADSIVQQGEISTKKVDNSSYMYECLSQIIKEKNVMTRSTVTQEKIAFYLQRMKPSIVFEDGGEPESAIGSSQGPSNKYLKEDQLTYRFHIENESATSAVKTSYHCELFVDLNADGVFSNGSDSPENLQDIKVYTEDGEEVLKNKQQRYELKVNTTYTVTRAIPSNYYKLIQWKLQIESNDSNGEATRTSVTGYTKKKTPEDDKPTIKVLQICSRKNPTWNLSTDEQFKELMKQVEDFNISVDTKTVDEYANAYKEKGMPYLEAYDMVIVGFKDMQDDIPIPEGANTKETNPVLGLVQYIQDGNSVLFSHDTTSFVNQVIDVEQTNHKQWGYNLNTIMRPLVGMDRYSVTLTEEVKDGVTVSDILKKGLGLTSNSKPVSLEEIQSHVSDMAYRYDSLREETDKEVQGYANTLLKGKATGWDIYETNQAVQINQGAITQYPYVIDENLTVSTTHSQYYQLGLEEDQDQDGTNDIVVWYTLAGDEYDKSPKDVRNNYYLYSKGNVLYTGVGHSVVNQEMEKKLFVNTIVAAWRAGKSNPKVTFLEQFKADSNQQTIKYYTTDEERVTDDNLIKKEMNLYLTFEDIKLIPASQNYISSTLSVDFFIEDEKNGTANQIQGLPSDVKVSPLTVDSLQEKTNTGTKECENITVDLETGLQGEGTKTGIAWKVKGGNVYQAIFHDITSYVQTEQEYKMPNIYARVTVNYSYYGKKEVARSYAKVKLYRRQLFMLD